MSALSSLSVGPRRGLPVVMDFDVGAPSPRRPLLAAIPIARRPPFLEVEEPLSRPCQGAVRDEHARRPLAGFVEAQRAVGVHVWQRLSRPLVERIEHPDLWDTTRPVRHARTVHAAQRRRLDRPVHTSRAAARLTSPVGNRRRRSSACCARLSVAVRRHIAVECVLRSRTPNGSAEQPGGADTEGPGIARVHQARPRNLPGTPYGRFAERVPDLLEDSVDPEVVAVTTECSLRLLHPPEEVLRASGVGLPPVGEVLLCVYRISEPVDAVALRRVTQSMGERRFMKR